MSVTEYERNQLFAWFEEHMGKERAEALMGLLPPVGWADVATKRDLDVAAERLEAQLVATKRDLDVVAERLDARCDRLELTVRADLNELRSDLQRTFVTWMFATQGAVVAALGLLIAVTC
jgi:hypothetical protein